MAREDKPGIKYFSQDSDHVLNDKIKLLFIEFDSHGPWVWECLKCEIYSKKGYYFDVNDPDKLMIFASDVCKKPVSLVKEIIGGCIRRELFDKRVFDTFAVLTSDRIQKNYLDGNREKRKKGYGIQLIADYLLIEIGQNERSITFYRLKDKFSRERSELSGEKVHKGDEMRGDEMRGDLVVEFAEAFEFLKKTKNYRLATEKRHLDDAQAEELFRFFYDSKVDLGEFKNKTKEDLVKHFGMWLPKYLAAIEKEKSSGQKENKVDAARDRHEKLLKQYSNGN